MNDTNFNNAINILSASQQVDATFWVKWLQGTLSTLNELRKQQSAIKHPRHRGDAREDGISEIIKSFVPSSLNIAKGYGLNKHSAKSNEQDFLILNGDQNTCIAKTNSIGFYPIESILASIEIKSKLTLSELRKALVNCASLKSLTRHPFDKEKNDNTKIFYGIFSYDSTKELIPLSEDINKLCRDIPYHLKPNSIYVLGKGALIPASNKGFPFHFSQFFENFPFSPMEGFGTKAIPASEASAFLYFLSGLIDHCKNEKKIREAPSLMEYLATPFINQNLVEKIMEQNEKIKSSNVDFHK